MRLEPLAKAIASLLWVDGKVEENEMVLSKNIFEKYGLSWNDAKPVLEKHIEAFLDPGDEATESDEKGEFVEFDEDFTLGCLDFGEDVDSYDVVKDLCLFAVLDKQVEYKEIELILHISDACNLDRVLATAALLSAVQETGSKINL